MFTLCCAQVLIEIDDDAENRSLHFTTDFVRLSVREDAAVSTVVYVASAVERFSSQSSAAVPSSSSQVLYSLRRSADDDDPHFDVDRRTGRVQLRRRLDRETASVHRFTVLAVSSEAGNHLSSSSSSADAWSVAAQLDVEISVVDVNDNAPTFDRAAYVCRLSPPSSTAMTTTTTPTTTTTKTTTTPKHQPAAENTLRVGRSLVTSSRCAVHATDDDEGPAARLTYHFDVDDDDDDRDLFEIDPQTGEISWEPTAFGDGRDVRCAPGAYRLRVVATDDGMPPRRSTSVAIVTVTATGGPCEPRFDGLRRLTIAENQPAYSRIGTVAPTVASGSPAEMPGVRYSLVAAEAESGDGDPLTDGTLIGARFAVDPATGELFTRVVLDREARSRYKFRIVASVAVDDVTAGENLRFRTTSSS
jgi:hypothetical protein